MHAVPMDGRAADRRPAIWPWLVMPLIALTLFYCLDSLKKAQDQKDYRPAAAVSARPQADSQAN
jgi:hypothetical protein